MSADADADAGGDLFERLDALERAEPLPAEDDLILRMSSSKLRGRTRKSASPSKSTAASNKPRGAIGKRPKSGRRRSDPTSANAGGTSAMTE